MLRDLSLLGDHETASTEAPPLAALHGRRSNTATRLRAYPKGSPRRFRVERFIQQVYARRYGATLHLFAPVLVAVHAGEHIVAAAGYRPASEPLFLERYLRAPVEQCLQAAQIQAPPRERIVEVGHLASVRPGAGRLLMPMLGRHLAERGFEWVVATATEELRELFARVGLAPIVLGAADPAVLGVDAQAWGSYYAHRPLVVAGSIASGMAQLTRRGGR